MNRPPLRLTRPGQLPAPATGDDSLHILTDAIEHLARLRTPYWLGDSAVRLHALTSLIAQAGQLRPQAVHDARDQELTWAQIGELFGTTAATAARRYRNRRPSISARGPESHLTTDETKRIRSGRARPPAARRWLPRRLGHFVRGNGGGGLDGQHVPSFGQGAG
jgi:hypothetical protein